MPSRLADRLAPLRPKLIVLFHETWKYFLVSALSLGVDMGVFWALVQLAGVHYLAANIVSVSVGLVVNYGLSVAFVFKERRLQSRQAEFLGFVLIGLAGLVVNEALIWLFVEQVRLAPLPGKLAAAGGSFVFNFAVRRALLFTAKG
jgi:putative flippase GtrA